MPINPMLLTMLAQQGGGVGANPQLLQYLGGLSSGSPAMGGLAQMAAQQVAGMSPQPAQMTPAQQALLQTRPQTPQVAAPQGVAPQVGAAPSTLPAMPSPTPPPAVPTAAPAAPKPPASLTVPPVGPGISPLRAALLAGGAATLQSNGSPSQAIGAALDAGLPAYLAVKQQGAEAKEIAAAQAQQEEQYQGLLHDPDVQAFFKDNPTALKMFQSMNASVDFNALESYLARDQQGKQAIGQIVAKGDEDRATAYFDKQHPTMSVADVALARGLGLPTDMTQMTPAQAAQFTAAQEQNAAALKATNAQVGPVATRLALVYGIDLKHPETSDPKQLEAWNNAVQSETMRTLAAQHPEKPTADPNAKLDDYIGSHYNQMRSAITEVQNVPPPSAVALAWARGEGKFGGMSWNQITANVDPSTKRWLAALQQLAEAQIGASPSGTRGSVRMFDQWVQTYINSVMGGQGYNGSQLQATVRDWQNSFDRVDAQHPDYLPKYQQWLGATGGPSGGAGLPKPGQIEPNPKSPTGYVILQPNGRWAPTPAPTGGQ